MKAMITEGEGKVGLESHGYFGNGWKKPHRKRGTGEDERLEVL